jgi:hypothetical protein
MTVNTRRATRFLSERPEAATSGRYSTHEGRINLAKVKLSEIVDALELQFDDLSYFLNKETAEVVGIQGEEFRAAEEEESLENYPEWQRESIVIAGDVLFSVDKYIALPAKFEVDEYAMMERFCWSRHEPHA